MSYEALKRQFSACLTFLSNRSIPKQQSLRAPMTSSTRGLKAAFLRMSRETTRETIRVPARRRYHVATIGEGRGSCGNMTLTAVSCGSRSSGVVLGKKGGPFCYSSKLGGTRRRQKAGSSVEKTDHWLGEQSKQSVSNMYLPFTVKRMSVQKMSR